MKRWLVIVMVIVLLLIPFPTEMVPEWKLRVVDREGNALAGVQIEEAWTNYSYFGQHAYELRRSDKSGEVIFPRRMLWAGAIQRVSGIVISNVMIIAHGSKGLSIDGRVFDSDYASDKQISWYSERDTGVELPQTIVAIKSNGN